MPPRRKPAPPPSAAQVNMMRQFLRSEPAPVPAPLPRTPSGLLPASAFILTADTNRPEAQAARIQTAVTDLPVKTVPAPLTGKEAPVQSRGYRPGLSARIEHQRLALTPGYRERDVYHRNPDVDERTALYMRIKALSLFPNIYAH